jgi:hypothetical protein
MSMPYKGEGPVNLEIGNLPESRPKSKTVSSKVKSSTREKVIGVNVKRTFERIEMDPSLFKI